MNGAECEREDDEMSEREQGGRQGRRLIAKSLTDRDETGSGTVDVGSGAGRTGGGAD